MKMLARILGIASALALVLALGACGGGGGGSASGQGASGGSAQQASEVAGTWDFSGVRLADGTTVTLHEFAETYGVDVSLLQTSYVFKEDGTVTMSNMNTGLIEGTWQQQGDTVTVTAAFQGVEATVPLALGKDASGATIMTQANDDGTTSIMTKMG